MARAVPVWFAVGVVAGLVGGLIWERGGVVVSTTVPPAGLSLPVQPRTAPLAKQTLGTASDTWPCTGRSLTLNYPYICWQHDIFAVAFVGLEEFPVQLRDPRALESLNVLVILESETKVVLDSHVGDFAVLQWLVFRSSVVGTLPSQIGRLGSSLGYLSAGENEGLGGTIPTQLGLLSHVTGMCLCVNDLGGSIPSQLGASGSLQLLDIARNRIEGTLPSELAKCTSLTTLTASFNALRGTIPSEFLLLPLKTLALEGNFLSQDFTPLFARLSNVTSLSLGSNRGWGSIPSQIGRMTRLETLYQRRDCFPCDSTRN